MNLILLSLNSFEWQLSNSSNDFQCNHTVTPGNRAFQTQKQVDMFNQTYIKKKKSSLCQVKYSTPSLQTVNNSTLFQIYMEEV